MGILYCRCALRMNRKIRDSFFMIVLIPIAAVTWWSLHEIETVTRNTLASTLQATLNAAQGALHIWSNNAKQEAKNWAESKNLQRLTAALLAAQDESPSKRQLIKEFREYLGVLLKQPDHVGAVLINQNGEQIAALYDLRLNRKQLAFANREVLPAAFAGKTVIGRPFLTEDPLSPPGQLRAELMVLHPVRDGTNRVIAVLAILHDPHENFTKTVELGRIGRSGETYAFDRRGYFLTPSRFFKQNGISPSANEYKDQISIPGSDSLTLMARSATSGESRVSMDPYPDYRGVPVVGAWLWDTDLGIGLTTEMDADEAYHPLWITRSMVVFVLMIVTLCGAIVTTLLWKRRVSLERALNIRDEFISVASHELRTPLTALKLRMDMLTRLAKKGSSPEVLGHHLIETSNQSIKQINRLNRLIDELLDVSRARVGKFAIHREPTQLDEIIKDVVRRNQEAFRQAGSEIELPNLPKVSGLWDPHRMDQVIANLVSNAIRYGGGKPIAITLERVDRLARLSVRDHGIGIPAADQSRIFERFERAAATNPDGGLGLGLYITRSIVEAHGGKAHVESRPGKGSTFIVELPVAPPT